MTRDDIITMASEAQGGAESHCDFFAMTLDALERFAAIRARGYQE
jgi:hypothetical protein